MRSPTRARGAVVLGLAVLVGLLAQLDRTVTGTDAIGTLAYAGAAVGAFAVLGPHRGVWLPGGLGTAAACAVELFQLTGVPAAAADQVPMVALLLGSRFSLVDLALLAVGGTVATAALAIAPPTRRAGQD